MPAINSDLYNKIGCEIHISNPINNKGILVPIGNYIIIGVKDTFKSYNDIIIIKEEKFYELIKDKKCTQFSIYCGGLFVTYDSIYKYINIKKRITIENYGYIGIQDNYCIFNKFNEYDNINTLNYTYEYKVKTLSFYSNKELEDLLNEMGNNAWELCNIDTVTERSVYIFKRKKYFKINNI